MSADDWGPIFVVVVGVLFVLALGGIGEACSPDCTAAERASEACA